jgi:uncharacterized NAD-dependent epimerase/dehydratase family protein
MLSQSTKLAIYMEGALGNLSGKMGYGVLRYSPHQVVAVVDKTHAGGNIKDFAACVRACPIVDSLTKARALGANTLILGIAPPGGRIPEEWYESIDHAVELGFSLVNGLHTHLAPRYSKLEAPQFVWDIRKEPLELTIGTGKARALSNKRVLFVGSDMACGKMTAALEVHRAAQENNIRSAFIATGQIGITISGAGIALDAIRLDYACGAVEHEVLNAKDADLVLVEGQGSIVHPGSTATLPLLRGSCPTHLIFCHRAYQDKLSTAPDVAIPSLKKLISLYEDVAEACGTFTRPTTLGVCLNTGHLSHDEAMRAIAETEQATGLPCVDVVRQSAARLLPFENLGG